MTEQAHAAHNRDHEHSPRRRKNPGRFGTVSGDDKEFIPLPDH
jgi:hypothetical protein